MKNRKRNLTMLAVLMFVCAAVALNWSYNNRWGSPDSEMVSMEDEAMLNASAENEELIGSGYFAEARLTRQVSRDEDSRKTHDVQVTNAAVRFYVLISLDFLRLLGS